MSKILKKNDLLKILFIILILNILNFLIFIINLDYINLKFSIFSDLNSYLLNFSKTSTQTRGHFPFVNYTTYSFLPIFCLYMSLLYFKLNFKIYIVIFFCFIKIFSFFDKSSILISLLILLFYFIKIKFDLNKILIILLTVLLSFSTINSLQLFSDYKSSKNDFIYNFNERYQVNNIETSHKIQNDYPNLKLLVIVII